MPASVRLSHAVPLFIALLLASPHARSAEEPALHQFRSLSLEAASKAAWEAVRDCRKRGYSVAVAVVDRGGNTQSLLRDRYAGPHTTEPLFARPGRRTVFVNPLLISLAC